MLDKPYSKAMQGGFQRAYNPHLKGSKRNKLAQEEAKANINNEILSEAHENQASSKTNKEDFAKELIKNGYIDSFVDFFYLGWGKTPNLKIKYSNQNEEEEGEEDVKEEEQEIMNNEIIPRHEYNIGTLNVFFEKLIRAENASRDAEMDNDMNKFKEAIEQYNSIRNDTIHDQGVPLEAIYFNQKCIDISKKYNLIESLIQSLIFMGGCFDKMSNPVDMNISKGLKEKAKEIFLQNLAGKNYVLESTIYKSLIELYNELANQQEQMKNYKKAIDLLYKLLEILEALKEISPNLKEGGLTDKENEDKKTESYLKISNLYYRMKDYDNVIETLGKIPNIKSESESNLSVKYFFNFFYYYRIFKFKVYIDMLKHMKCKVVMKMQ